jgi:hypothetical protein
MSMHGFLVIDGKGYGLFEQNLNSIGTSDIRDTDLTTYPENGAQDFYSTCTSWFLEDCCYDVKIFLTSIRDHIARDMASPGTYVFIGANCFTWRTGVILDAVHDAWNGKCVWLYRLSKFNDAQLPQLVKPACCE